MNSFLCFILLLYVCNMLSIFIMYQKDTQENKECLDKHIPGRCTIIDSNITTNIKCKQINKCHEYYSLECYYFGQFEEFNQTFSKFLGYSKELSSLKKKCMKSDRFFDCTYNGKKLRFSSEMCMSYIRTMIVGITFSFINLLITIYYIIDERKIYQITPLTQPLIV